MTACFDRVMNEAWFDKLDEINHHTAEKPMITLGLISFGFLAPFYVMYRNQQQEELSTSLQEHSSISKDEELHSYGINYYMSADYSRKLTFRSYVKRFVSFHESPKIKMFYDFVANIWLLLIFSYMMLYQFDRLPDNKFPHWTEIFLIIAITTNLVEALRQVQFRT